jgi:cytoplasmic iron level regulating protein YaaA (DUF328/UPF0246 family)
MSSARAVPRGAFVVVLSPAKALNEAKLTHKQRAIIAEVTQPRFAARATAIAEVARRELTAGKIKSLMGVSDAIATLNVGRFEAFESAETKPCALAFDGPAFKHLNADGLETEEETTYLQTHLRVLSGMYGVLRPYDAIAPYRMEMGTRWAPGAPKDLYEYWGTDIANSIADDVEAQAKSTQTKPFVLNCASQEYWKSVKSDVLEKRGIPVYTASFPGPAVYAKQARGAMVRHCIDARVSSPQDLKAFVGTDGSWSYDSKASTEFNFVFTRGAKRAAGAGGVKGKAGGAASKKARSSKA